VVHIEDEQKGADFCVDLVTDGKAGFIIKGKILTTYMFRSLIKGTMRLKQNETLSGVSIHQVKGLNKP